MPFFIARYLAEAKKKSKNSGVAEDLQPYGMFW